MKKARDTAGNSHLAPASPQSLLGCQRVQKGATKGRFALLRRAT